MNIKKIITIVAVLAASFTTFAQTQADAPATEQADAAAPIRKEKSILDLWNAGGLTMYPLGLLSVAGISLIIYNFISLRKNRYLAPKSIEQIEAMLNNMQIEEARNFCEKNPSPITNILGSGLSRIYANEVDVDVIEGAMSEASIEELSTPYTLINYISVIATIAPMVGLYGTVSGMVKAFETIAAEGAGSAQKLADNISEALITTASGMIIGIPGMVFFFFFKNKFATITSGIGRIIGDLVFTLNIAHKYGPQEIEGVEFTQATAEYVEETPAAAAPVATSKEKSALDLAAEEEEGDFDK
ncbi:MAG: MotA/TolQ/ExbB proton channel family protein [Opitutales bacterium]